jgi:endonuclease YncB( thermonuclease family)
VTKARLTRWVIAAAALLALAVAPVASTAPSSVYRIDHVVDGDTVDLANGAKVRLVQIDTPEVYFGAECYGPRASAIAKRLLPYGTKVRLAPDPATDRVDRYGRLLRYVIRARDGLNVNMYLVRIGAAAPYFYDSVAGTRRCSTGSPGEHAPDISGCGAHARTRHTIRTGP